MLCLAQLQVQSLMNFPCTYTKGFRGTFKCKRWTIPLDRRSLNRIWFPSRACTISSLRCQLFMDTVLSNLAHALIPAVADTTLVVQVLAVCPHCMKHAQMGAHGKKRSKGMHFLTMLPHAVLTVLYFAAACIGELGFDKSTTWVLERVKVFLMKYCNNIPFQVILHLHRLHVQSAPSRVECLIKVRGPPPERLMASLSVVLWVRHAQIILITLPVREV